LAAVGVAGRDPRLIRVVTTFDCIEWGRVEPASFHQLARAEAIGKQFAGEEHAEGGPVRIVWTRQAGQRELDRSKAGLALAPIFRGPVDVTENAAADSLAIRS
jgi:hypothetical protein